MRDGKIGRLVIDPKLFIELPLIGILAGTVGGFLGVGGGLVMIPALVLLLGDHYGAGSLHLYKLASIAASIIVSIPAAVRHARAKAVVFGMLPSVLPLAVIGVVAGVYIAGRFFAAEHTHWLRRGFGGFLELVVAVNVYQNWLSARGADTLCDRCPLPRRYALLGSVIGLPSGLIAGLLGIGGGVWNVPAQHLLFGMQLRHSIATSSYIVIFVSLATAVIQGIEVNHMAGLTVPSGLSLAALLAPGAVIGGWLGAGLTHRLPTRWLRHAFHALLVITGIRLMLG